MKSIELMDKSDTKLFCPLCEKLLLESGEEFKTCEHVLFVATDAGEFSFVKEGVPIDQEPDLNELELNMDEYTDSLDFENAFKIALYTPAPSGFGAYFGFQQG